MVTRIHKLLAVCLAVASWSLSVACKSTSPKVETRNGTYSGLYIQEFNQDAFLGIPFGQAARLGLPTALNEAWDEVRPATTIGDACLGSLPQAAQELLNVSTSDDCLNLNIVRPSGYKNKLLPVMVWIYGGGFSVGFNGNPNENTSYVIKASVENGTPIMSVSINYRVGFYGFPGGVQATQAGIVNLGLKDQRLALAWIQENIEAFGGDPNKVTLWGQSAGSASIGYQWLAYDGQGAEDLFRGTILVSGGALSSNMLYPTHPNCIEGYENILNVTGCDAADNTLECVKEASVDDVLLASSTAPFPTWWPSIDGDFIVRPPDWQLQMGHFSPKISSIVGANNDEGLLSANVYAQGVETEEDLEQVLKILFPAARDSVLQEVLDAYPADGPNPPYSLPTSDDQFCEAMTEAGLPCPGQYRRVAAIVGDYAQIGARRVQARGYSAGGAKVYSYRYVRHWLSFMHGASLPCASFTDRYSGLTPTQHQFQSS